MSKNFLRNIAIACAACFVLSAVFVVLCANYLVNYKPETDKEGEKTYVVTNNDGEEEIIKGEPLDGSYNFLVLGMDRAAFLTDVIMLVNYNTNTKSITVLQIPRDSYVSEDVSVHKINATVLANYNKAIQTEKDEDKAMLTAVQGFADSLEKALGVSIYKTAFMDLNGFVNIVDILGGVEVDVPTKYEYDDIAQDLHIHLEPGLQTLTGEQAEQFVRYRKSFLQADIGRENSQKIFISAFMKKAKESINISNLGTLKDIADEVLNNLITDVTVSDMVYLAKGLLGDVDLANMKMMTAPGNCYNHENGINYYVVHRQCLMDIITTYFNTTNINKEVIEQNFDVDAYFYDKNSYSISGGYFSEELPPINQEYTADDVNENSIYIPEY